MSSVDPRSVRVAALISDVQTVGENLSMIIAEAMVLELRVPPAVRDAVAALDRWTTDLRRA